MAISWPCPLSVLAYAAAGRDAPVPRPPCPGCGETMTFEGSYGRMVREAGVLHVIRVPRAYCRGCGVSHALVPDFVVHRRRDSVGAIGAALAAGAGPSSAAHLWADVPARTVRSWRQRFASRAELLTAGLMAVTTTLARLPKLPVERGPATVAVAAVGAAWWAASRRWPGRVPGPWRLANLMVGSHLLSTRVDLPWPGAGARADTRSGPLTSDDPRSWPPGRAAGNQSGGGRQQTPHSWGSTTLSDALARTEPTRPPTVPMVVPGCRTVIEQSGRTMVIQLCRQHEVAGSRRSRPPRQSRHLQGVREGPLRTRDPHRPFSTRESGAEHRDGDPGSAAARRAQTRGRPPGDRARTTDGGTGPNARRAAQRLAERP